MTMQSCENSWSQCTGGHTVVMVAVNGRVGAVIGLTDCVRPEAKLTLAHLARLGFEPEILSGDTQTAVNRIATVLSISQTHAVGGLSPEEKLTRVRGTGAVMIGDGVNDAAALAASDVGIAVHGGADAALEAADVYIAKGGLDAVVELVETARYTLSVVRRNVIIATAYNLIAGTLAIAGQMHPLTTAILMPLSSASVLFLTVSAIRRGPRSQRR